jgi:hypothetical protein
MVTADNALPRPSRSYTVHSSKCKLSEKTNSRKNDLSENWPVRRMNRHPIGRERPKIFSRQPKAKVRFSTTHINFFRRSKIRYLREIHSRIHFNWVKSSAVTVSVHAYHYLVTGDRSDWWVHKVHLVQSRHEFTPVLYFFTKRTFLISTLCSNTCFVDAG